MSVTKQEIQEIELRQKYREVYKYEPVLFGLLSSERLVKKDKVGGEELWVYVSTIPEKVLVNGIEYIKKDKK